MFPKRKYDFNYKLPAINGGLIELEDIHRISPFFTPTNPITYAVFLDANKDKLTDDEKERTRNIMRHLFEKEQEVMRAVSEYFNSQQSKPSST